MTKIIVTADNLEDVKEMIGVRDQAAELKPGCESWGFFYSGGCRGQITIWPEEGRAAIEFGGDSAWGDWDADRRIIVTDVCDEDGAVIAYDEDGERVDMSAGN